ncbi:MAG TPA: alpha/beta hydrolase [Acidimicrobiia bacterium]|nr:alpha/beta hydrolase [Acidimicrobiia bacterium]
MSAAKSTTDRKVRKTEGFRVAEQAVWDRYGLTPRERMVEAGGTLVRVNEVGDGPPILFVHGSGGSGAYWSPLVQHLQGRFRCLLMDRPGWANTAPIDYSRTAFGTIAADLLEGVLAALAIDRAHAIGGSIGDLFVLRLAIARPARVDRVVLLGGGPLVNEIEPPTFIRLLRSPFGRVLVRIPQKPGMIRKQMEGLGHKRSLASGEIPAELINLYSATSRHTEAMRYERDLVRSVLTKRGWVPGFALSDSELPSVAAPTLMIYGSDDPVGSLPLWDKFAGSLPNGTLWTAPGCGHLPWYDKPREVAGQVTSFL